MKRVLLALLLLSFVGEVRGDISGYARTTPVLDAEIHPRLVAAAPDGTVWFAQQTTTPYSIGFFTPAGHVTNFPIPCTKCASGQEVMYVWDLAAASDGSVWFIDNHANANGSSIDSAIGHLTASGDFTFFPIPTKDATAVVPNGFGHSFLALAPDGTVWFTENAAYKAGKLTPSTRAFAEYPLEMAEQPSGITIGPDGKVWYAVADHEIAQITPPSNGEYVEFGLAIGSYPLGLAIGPDGNLWLTEAGRHKVGRFKPSGTVTEFALPTNNGVPQHIIAAPDGTLWYTESAGMDVGRITLDEAGTPSFESLSTPGLQNFDLTVAGATVYVTGRDVATQQDRLYVIAPAKCANGPVVNGPYDVTATRMFHGAFTISGRDPLTVTIDGLPASWTAQPGKVTIVDSGANPKLGTYTFTISVTDGDGCSDSRVITVTIVDPRHRTVRH